MAKVQRAKKKEAARREPADLPADIEDLDPASPEAIVAGDALQDAYVEDGDLSQNRIRELAGKGSVVERVSFASCDISSAHFRDVRFTKCDFSNTILHRFEGRRVEFIDCKLVGMKAIECHWEDVLVEGCDARYAQFTDGEVIRCEFRKSHMGECDLRGANLHGTLFVDANLASADLSRTKLEGIDLRTCEIEGLIVRAEDLHGAIVSAPQALELSRLLGLVIR